MKIIPHIIYLDENNYKIFEDFKAVNQYMSENNQWKIREMWYIVGPGWILDKIQDNFKQVKLFTKEFIKCENQDQFYDWLKNSELEYYIIHYPDKLTVDDINPIENSIVYFTKNNFDVGSVVTIINREIKYLNIVYVSNRKIHECLCNHRPEISNLSKWAGFNDFNFNLYCVNNITEIGKDDHYVE